jgi:surface polysaccharide O-acyltransferase-like enzyme
MVHAAGRYPISSQELTQMNVLERASWGFVDVYQSLAVPLGVPLFLMLTGALLLQPQKKDTLRGFFKKRWVRIGLPTLFWAVAYFAWDFLVQKIPFSSAALIQGTLNGPYTHMWYIYVLVGLYLLTPILRIFVANADETLMKYFGGLWGVTVSIVPVFGLFTSYTLNSNVFALTGYVGFFVLGTYLTTVNNKPPKTGAPRSSIRRLHGNLHLCAGGGWARQRHVFLPAVFQSHRSPHSRCGVPAAAQRQALPVPEADRPPRALQNG